MRLKHLLEKSSLDYLYGGMDEDGGYDSNTEYEIGLQRYCEAAHCILGSLAKAYPTFKWLNVERGHVREEYGIMEKVLNEYSRDVYEDQILGRLKENDKYVNRTRENMTVVSKELNKKAKYWKENLGEMREDVKMVAELCYDCLIIISEKAEETFIPIDLGLNFIRQVFRNKEVKNITDELGKAIKKVPELR